MESAPASRETFGQYWRRTAGMSRHYRPGAYIDLERTAIAVVLDGRLALEASYADGSASWLALFAAGSAFRRPRVDANVCEIGLMVTHEGPAEVARLTAETVRALPLDAKAWLAQDVMRTQETILRFAAARAHRYAPHRVLAVLLELSGTANVPILLSQESIGSLAKTTRESVNHVLTGLVAARTIETASRMVRVLNRKALTLMLTRAAPASTRLNHRNGSLHPKSLKL